MVGVMSIAVPTTSTRPMSAHINLVAGIAACRSSSDGGERLALAATDCTAQQTTCQPTDHSASDAIFVLDRRLVPHLNVFAFLVRRHDSLEDLLHCDDFGSLRLGHRLVARDGASSEHHHGDATDCDSLDH